MAEEKMADGSDTAVTPPDSEVKTPSSSRGIRGSRWALVVVSILTSTFLFGLDNTIVADVQPAIVDRFDSLNRLPWLSVAFTVGAASTTLLWGQMYGVFNAKWLYITCVIIFEIGSAVCGASPSMSSLIVGRAICGLGGTGMYTGVLTLLSILTEENERATYFGLSGLVWGLGTVLGPIIGGAFTSSSAGWRWSFYINLVIAGVCAPVYLFMIPSTQPFFNGRLPQRLQRIDFLGTILLIGAFVSGLMAISFGGVLFEWGSARIIALFVVAAVLVAVFLAQQLVPFTVSLETRAFPFQFFRNRALTIVFVLECCASTLTYIPVYFIPLYFQFAQQNTALQAGVRTLPLVVFLVGTIVISGFVVSATGRYMPWFLVGGILGLAGSALLYTSDVDTTNAKIYGYSILVGTGAGCFLQLPFSVVQSLVPPAEIPKAISFVTFGQLGAPSVMLSVVNAVFLNEASHNIARAFPKIPQDAIISILSGVGSETFNQMDHTAQRRIIGFTVDGLNQGYIVTMSSGALALLLSLVLPRGKMFG